MPNLYTLTDNALRLMAALEGADETEYAQLVAEYEANAGDIADKLDGYARIIRTLETDAEAFKAEKARIEEAAKRMKNTAERLREAVRVAMVTVGTNKVKTSIGTWSLQKERASVRVFNEGAIPSEYKIPQPAALDKNLMRAEMLEGVIIEGAELEYKAPLVLR